jgi:hypothetical protein
MADLNRDHRTSIAQRVRSTHEPFTFFHTWTVSEDLISRAIHEQKSMDLDVCIDDAGNPYLGHSHEYHAKSGEAFFQSLSFHDVIEQIAQSTIVVMIDCKHYDAWPTIEETVVER